MVVDTTAYTEVASLDELRARGRMVVHAADTPIVLFFEDGQVSAVDNRCPHMGFPLHRGTVSDGILTCHWHHARFDLCGGGTFDQWADDVRSYPVEIRDERVFLDLRPRSDQPAHQRERLRDGLEQDINLVIAKAVIALVDTEGDPVQPFEIGLLFGSQYRDMGWGQGLTMLTALMNILPHLEPGDRPRALYHGLSAVARDTATQPPRFPVGPLPGTDADLPTLKRWFRRFVEVRDADGAERCIASAIAVGGTDRQVADLLFAAATDHRYLQAGHVLDFTNKALEALDIAGWQHAGIVLTSLARSFATATRMEESNAWRNPVDLVALLDRAFDQLPGALEMGRARRRSAPDRRELAALVLGDDPQAIPDGLVDGLRAGATGEEIASAIAYAAATRVAQFHLSNEFGDWDTVLHTFTFANAVHQGMRRSPSIELLRGAFDAAMSVYLDRFLNTPATPIPTGTALPDAPRLPEQFLDLLDRRQQVNEAGELAARSLASGGDAKRLRAALGSALLREDRDFHTIQMVEAAFRQQELWGDIEEGRHFLIAAARYLAAHAATPRAQLQTYTIAERLHRSEALYEG